MRRGHHGDSDQKRGLELWATVETIKSQHAFSILLSFFDLKSFHNFNLNMIHPSLAFHLLTRRDLAH